jgi:Nucleotidyltransferase of unknown function (DUF6036)
MPPRSRTLTITPNWKAFLTDVDTALSQGFTLRCLGGFVLAAMYGLPRPTGDMDYIEITPIDRELELSSIAGPESRLAKKHRLFIHRATISQYPDEFESRMDTLDLSLQKLKLHVLGPYDLALSKLCSDRPKDTEDAKHLIREAALELDEFLRIWNSEMAYRVHPRYQTDIDLAREYFER